VLRFGAARIGAPDPDPQFSSISPEAGVGGKDAARRVSGTMLLHGETYAFMGWVEVGRLTPMTGGYGLFLTMLGTPARLASTEFPALIAMYSSLRVDFQAVHDQSVRRTQMMTQATMATINANHDAFMADSNRRFESSMANARAAQDAMDRSAAGFIHYINGTSVLQYNPTGGRSTVGSSLAQSLEAANPGAFSVVPISNYIKGIDF
jgi:hypothetical protein